MKEKISGLFNWGVGVFKVIMKSKLVSIGCFLFTGILHIINPRGGLQWTAGMLAGFTAIYALLSLIFVLTDNNEKVGKGREIAGGLVKGVVQGNKDPVVYGQNMVSKNKKVDETMKETNSKWDQSLQVLSEKQKEEPKAGKVVMTIFYSLLLIAAVLLFFWTDITITAVHIIVGALLIADGISGIASAFTAKKNNIQMKNRRLSFVLGILTVGAGVAFIIFSKSTAELTMVVCGVVLIIKGLADLIVMIRNREIVSSVKETVAEIKQQ